MIVTEFQASLETIVKDLNTDREDSIDRLSTVQCNVPASWSLFTLAAPSVRKGIPLRKSTSYKSIVCER